MYLKTTVEIIFGHFRVMNALMSVATYQIFEFDSSRRDHLDPESVFFHVYQGSNFEQEPQLSLKIIDILFLFL